MAAEPAHHSSRSLAVPQRLESSTSSLLYSECSSVPTHDGIAIPLVRMEPVTLDVMDAGALDHSPPTG